MESQIFYIGNFLFQPQNLHPSLGGLLRPWRPQKALIGTFWFWFSNTENVEVLGISNPMFFFSLSSTSKHRCEYHILRKGKNGNSIAMKLCNSCKVLRNRTFLFVKIFKKNVRFHKIQNHKDSENFSFLCWQTKKFCS